MTIDMNLAHCLVSDMMLKRHVDATAWTLCFVDYSSGELVVGYDPQQVSREMTIRRLRDVVKNIPLRLRAGGAAQRHAKKRDYYRPVIGGVILRVPEVMGEGTAGIVVIHDGQLGIITAGHVVKQINTIVYQPRKSEQNNWRIGITTRVSDYTGTAKSDSAFVEIDMGINAATWQIWKSNSSTYTVTNTGEPNLGDTVYMQGATTQTTERFGIICSLNATVRFNDSGVLTNQYLANYLTKVGDSGAPVYTKQADPNVTLIGINVGGTSPGNVTSGAPNPTNYPPNTQNEYAVISAWENVLEDLFDAE